MNIIKDSSPLIMSGDDVLDVSRKAEELSCKKEAGIDELVEGLADELNDKDVSFVNMEAPLLDIEPDADLFPKDEPRLRMPTKALRGIHRCGYDIVGIVTKHMLDLGENAFREFGELLEDYLP